MNDPDPQISAELQRHRDRRDSVMLDLWSDEAYNIIRFLQIAARHPALHPDDRVVVRQVAAHLVALITPHFDGDPAITAAIAGGWQEDETV